MANENQVQRALLAEKLDATWRQIRALDIQINDKVELVRSLRNQAVTFERQLETGADLGYVYSPLDDCVCAF